MFSGSFRPTATAAISARRKARAPPTLDYFRQIAVAADTLGYEGVLLPTGRSCEDAWVVASSLIPATKRLKFLVAIRPGCRRRDCRRAWRRRSTGSRAAAC